jgi:hypothetical protein
MTNTEQQFPSTMPTTMPTTMEERLHELANARAMLLAELEDGNFDPNFSEAGRWSVGEIAYHLYLVESRITGLLKALLGSSNRSERANEDRLNKEWELTSSRAGNPEIRAQAPPGTLPEQAPILSESIVMLKRSRAELLALMNQFNLDDLASVLAPHPMETIGVLTGAGWLSLVAHHEMRHTRQVRDLKAKQLNQTTQ